MPLRVFARGDVWWVRGTIGPPQSRTRIYESTGLSSRIERARAEAYALQREKEVWDVAVFGKRAVVTYAEAAASYLEQSQPGRRDAAAVGRLVEHFGTSRLIEVVADGGQAQLDAAIRALCRPDAAPDTKIRGVRTPHIAVINHAARRGWCGAPSFEAPQRSESRTGWLRPAEAARLVDNAAPHLKPLFAFLLGTGARVGEALSLTWDDVDLVAGTAVFWEDRTKSGKKRVAKLSPKAVVALANLSHREGAVFRRPGTKLRPLGAPYAAKDAEGGQFKTGWRAACRRAGLIEWEVDRSSAAATTAKLAEGRPVTPVRWLPRFTPHTLRHTWATYWQAACDQPTRLRDEGGWSTVSLVERYAHRMKQEDVPVIALVWGVAHPDLFPAERRASAVHDQAQLAQAPAIKA